MTPLLLRSTVVVATMATATLATAAEPDQRVVAAARARDGARVVALVEQGADPNDAQADGATALHWAAYWSDGDIAARLIRAGANVNAANDLGVTPLWLASAGDDPTLVQRLLDAGADPNRTQARGTSPLMEAARTGRVANIVALLQRGAIVDARETTHDQTALMWAAAHRQGDAVQALIDGGADVHLRSRVRPRKAFVKSQRGGSYDPDAFARHVASGEIVDVDEGGYSALLFAVQQNDTTSVARLLAAGADVNETAPSGMSALIVAAYSNHAAVGRLLLEHHADARAAGPGYTALHAAILRGNVELVRDLLAHGADVNTRVARPSGARRQSADYAIGDSLVGATPVFLAAKFAEIQILRLLIDAHADTAATLPNGTTPLIAAMATGTINSLGGEGLGEDRRDRNVFFRVYNTQSAEEIEEDVLAIVQELSRAHVDVNAAGRDGNTALHAAARAGLDRVISRLVAEGARVDTRNRRGETPLGVAAAPRENRGGDVFVGRTTTVDLLRQLGASE